MEFKNSTFKKDIYLKRAIENDWSLEVAAKEIGISKATLSRIERGHLPDILTFAQVCEWLNKKPNRYFG